MEGENDDRVEERRGNRLTWEAGPRGMKGRGMRGRNIVKGGGEGMGRRRN